MDVTATAAFAALALSLIAVPGPDWAFILAAGARERVVLRAVAGVMAGYVLIAALVAGGAGTLVARTPVILTLLTVAGAAYLVYLGVRTLRTASSTTITASAAGRTGGHFGRGIAVSGLNPKGLLLFLAILPQFTDRDGWPMPAQLAVLGVLYIALAGTVYLTLGLLADRVVGGRPRAARMISRVSGVAMLAVGASLLIERFVLAG
ncbi:LysE family translocator [Gordonia sp. (in: high G+C Gram-positive bacteria)]|uniref:LysE family translocator n=1 Tax=Gordonia sp. (in: high G+C Gram-positive bacteria) TaxID=84139 RepID=UPI0035281F74